jgi:hypothetical protein
MEKTKTKLSAGASEGKNAINEQEWHSICPKTSATVTAQQSVNDNVAAASLCQGKLIKGIKKIT